MTREEAIQILSTRDAHGVLCGYTSGVTKALDMAIEALSQPIVAKCYEIDNDRVYCSPEMADKIYRALHENTNVQNMHKGEWIPCSERLPEDLEAVNVTWVNHNPPVYYQYTKDVPNADTAVYYRGVWYWWDSTICDVLSEYGEKCGAEQIDKDIEILAWMPLPKPYKGGDDE